MQEYLCHGRIVSNTYPQLQDSRELIEVEHVVQTSRLPAEGTVSLFENGDLTPHKKRHTANIIPERQISRALRTGVAPVFSSS